MENYTCSYFALFWQSQHDLYITFFIVKILLFDKKYIVENKIAGWTSFKCADSRIYLSVPLRDEWILLNTGALNYTY